MTVSRRITLTGSTGDELVGMLDLPDGQVRAYAMFAHCFTCSKDTIAAARISRTLAEAGVAVLRLDFTGLGESGGDFAETSFSTNIEDLVLAADHLREHHQAPTLLVGHSFGGAAVIAAAEFVPEVRAVATVSAPSDVAEIARHLAPKAEQIAREGEAVVTLAGRPFPIRQQFIDDLTEHSIVDRVAGLGRALLLVHSPDDEQVGYGEARTLYEAAAEPKSLFSLEGADHLLTAPGAAERAGAMIGAWAQAYLPDPAPSGLADGAVLVRPNGRGKFGQDVVTATHRLLADEPESVPGAVDSGPSPYDLLLAALGACTSMTMRMYADRKKWPLDDVEVLLSQKRMHARDCAECEQEDGQITRIERTIAISGDLDAEQRARLLEIADRCPVHRTLTDHPIVVVTEEATE